MAIFNAYYKNSNSTSSYQFEIEKSKAEFGIVAGGFYSTLSFSGDVFPKLTKADFSGSMGFAAGAFVDFTSVRDYGRSQFHLELLANTSSFESTFTYNRNDYLPYEMLYNTKLSYTMLNFNALYRYKIINNDIQIFVSPGLTFGYLLSETNTSVITTVFPSTPNQVRTEAAIPDGRAKFDFGFVGGAGLLYEDFSFEIRYSKSLRFESLNHVNSNYGSIAFLLGYKF